MQLEQERCHDTEIAAAAPERPVKVRVILRTDATQLAVRSNDIHFENIVDRQAKAPAQPAKSSAERQAAHAGVRHAARRCNQSVRHCLVIELAKQAATCNTRRLGCPVDSGISQL